MPVWLIDLVKSSPWVAVPLGFVWVTYKVFTKTSPPLFIATVVSVLGTKQMRDDALRTVEVLAEVKDDDPPAIESPPGQPPRTGRRPRRKRRR